MTKPSFSCLLAAACVLQASACGSSSQPEQTQPGGADSSSTAAPAASTPDAANGGAPTTTTSGAAAKPSGSSGNPASAAGSDAAAAADPSAAPSSAAGASAAAAGAASTKPPRVIPPGSVSKPGEYSGYGDKIYDGYELSSLYVEMRDGVKLAVDLYRPKKGGTVTDDPLPVVWMHTPYNRRYFASTAGAGLAGEVYPGAAALLVDYGYVAAVVDYRGVYASYGKNEGYNRGEWVDGARMDAYDMTEWFAEQPWSNGKVGMWGCSATGGSQMQALSVAPPHLKAIFPMSCEFDVYPFGVPGGMSAASGDTKAPPGASSSAGRDAMAQAVDDDPGGTMLRAATAQHSMNIENPGYAPFRDSVASNIPEVWWAVSSPHTYLDTILGSGIAVYAAANWDEAATKYGAFFTFNNLTNPRRLIVGSQPHCAWFDVKDETGFDLIVEERRFFDYWLKDIDNGIMDEPGVYYYTYNESKEKQWRSSPTWPLENEKRTDYFLGAKTLGTTAPTEASAKTDSVVDYNVTQGTTSVSGPANPRGIAFTTEPLAADVRVTGHPVAELWVASTANDGDFIATLQDVSPTGAITAYNMHGRLRASLRKEADAPYNNLGLPYHPFGQGDVMPLTPGEPTLIKFDLLPISFLFKAGHRIQVTLSFADTVTPRITPAPTVSIFHDAEHPSKVVLPIIEGD
jgi:uncharacterized protein